VTGGARRGCRYGYAFHFSRCQAIHTRRRGWAWLGALATWHSRRSDFSEISRHIPTHDKNKSTRRLCRRGELFRLALSCSFLLCHLLFESLRFPIARFMPTIFVSPIDTCTWSCQYAAMKDQRLIALITKEQMNGLLRLSKQNKVSLAEIVRRAIDSYLKGGKEKQ